MSNEVINQKKAVPYKRFNKDVGHKKGIGPGRYPIKASGVILSLVKLAESNARTVKDNKEFEKPDYFG